MGAASALVHLFPIINWGGGGGKAGSIPQVVSWLAQTLLLCSIQNEEQGEGDPSNSFRFAE